MAACGLSVLRYLHGTLFIQYMIMPGYQNKKSLKDEAVPARCE